MSQNTRWVAAIKAEALREASAAVTDGERPPGIDFVARVLTAKWLRDRANALVKEDDK